MRTDHILKDEADTGPSGLPPMPKHTVSIHADTASKELISILGYDNTSCKHFLFKVEHFEHCNTEIPTDNGTRPSL